MFKFLFQSVLSGVVVYAVARALDDDVFRGRLLEAGARLADVGLTKINEYVGETMLQAQQRAQQVQSNGGM